MKKKSNFLILHIAFLICSDWAVLHKEILHFRSIFSKNGFSQFLFYSCVKLFYITNLVKKNFVKHEFNCSNIICIPYFGKPSLIFCKHLLKLFKNHLQVDINVAFKKK